MLQGTIHTDGKYVHTYRFTVEHHALRLQSNRKIYTDTMLIPKQGHMMMKHGTGKSEVALHKLRSGLHRSSTPVAGSMASP